MKIAFLTFAAALLAAAAVQAGEVTLQPKEPVPPVTDDRWKFTLYSPGWMAGVEGDVGLDGVVSDVDLGFDNLVNKTDMIFALGAEASKGRFGVMAELIYLSLSDGVGADGLVKKIDVQLDEYLADFALRWRLIEGPDGYVDVIGGVRYTNLYQAIGLHPNDGAIDDASEQLVDSASDAIRDRLLNVLDEGQFRDALTGAIRESVADRLDERLAGRNPKLPVAPLFGRLPGDLDQALRAIFERKRAEIAAAISAGVANVEAEVERRLSEAREELEDAVENRLQRSLSRQAARGDDWWDPYIGLRARYNLTHAIYVTARGDIGGFGVGSDLMWQAQGALGCQITRYIFVEAGYRALSFDYENDGFLFDAITHGAQVTVGVTF